MIQKANQILQQLRNDDFDFKSTFKELKDIKKAYLQNDDEKNANICWVVENIVKAHQDYLEMFNKLKDGLYQDAWNIAEQVELTILAILRLCKGCEHTVELLAQNVRNLQSLYPYRLFISVEYLAKKRTCSICGKVRSIRSHCGHYVGYLYRGEMCYDEVEKFDLGGFAIVSNPVNKYSVLLAPDTEPDYRAIEGLMQYWKYPYMQWSYTVNTMFTTDNDGNQIPYHNEYVFKFG